MTKLDKLCDSVYMGAPLNEIEKNRGNLLYLTEKNAMTTEE